MNIKDNLWSALLLSTSALPVLWLRRLGGEFERVKTEILKVRPLPCMSYPCQKCCCALQVKIAAPDEIEASYPNCPLNCSPVKLEAADIHLLELDWQKLAQALCLTLELRANRAQFGLHNTLQIGAWSAQDVPVILTIQHETYDFEHVVGMLAARLREKFILLAPTSAHHSATTQEILTNVGAAFFPLDEHVQVMEDGSLKCRTSPGQLFQKFNPQPKEDEAERARQLFALVKALDTGAYPTPFHVFHLYCMDCLSADEVAKSCNCSKGTVINRLAVIRKVTGTEPDKLRPYSPHFERMEECLSDPRAQHIDRSKAA